MKRKSDSSEPAKAEEYDEQRIPFADVMRKLANTTPPHKAAKTPPKPKKA